MPRSAKFSRLVNYGFSGLLAALLSIAAYFVLKHKQCWVYDGDYENLEIIQITGTVCGSVIFVFSLLNTTAILYDIKSLLFPVVVSIIIVGGLMFWAVYIAFTQPCIGFEQIAYLMSNKSINAFSAKVTHNIVIMILDIIAGLSFLTIGCIFARRLKSY